jgi:hypothetical protein
VTADDMSEGWEDAALAGWLENPAARAAAPGRCLGEVAYQGYCDASDGKSLFNGDTLPAWSDQAQRIQDAWDSAAHAVARVVREDT